jgi:hypothetical protein
MIEFGDLQADLPTFQNNGALKVDNVIPLKKGYRALPGFQALSGTGLTSSAVGLFTSFSAGGSTNYAGDSTKLYQMDSSLVFQDISKVGGYNNSTTENARDFWAFTQFGSNIIGTNFADNIQKFEEGVDSDFSDLVSLKAKYIAVVRDFVVVGYTDESGTTYNQRVKWSGINDSSTWTPSQTTQSGYQDIVGSHGNIQQIVGGESSGIVFMEKAIYRMSYVGVPLIFQFDKIAVTPITRNSQLDSITVGDAVSTNDSGTCPLRSTSRYHRIRVNVDGNFNTLSGVDIEARPEGGR